MKKYAMPERERAAFERLRQPFAIYQFVDKRVVTLVLSDGFCDLFGYEDRALAYYDMDNNMYKDAHPDDVARIANAALLFATEGGRYETVYRTRRKDGPGYKVVHAMGEHVYTEDGTRLAHVWYTDEGDYVETPGDADSGINSALSDALREQSLLKASQYDYLTGLPSMTYFFELAEAGKEAYLKKGSQPMLLYFNFRGIKFFNTKHGFAEGDRALQRFAEILKQRFSTENCCRIGADHFAAITEEAGLEEKLGEIFREWQEFCRGNSLPVHVGIYRSWGDQVHVSVCLDRAKLACNALRDNYSSGFRYYSKDLSDDVSHKQYIIENLDRAIRENWIHVYLQPIIRAVNEKVSDVEALARWVDPERGVLSPAAFIPALEEAGLIYKLDLHMVDRVLQAIQIQAAEGFQVVPHSINLSRSDFDACDIVEEIRKRVDAAGVAHDRITIEITESVIGSDFEFMKAQVRRFQQLGFPVWMDDFGSGYSSLDVLQSIRFDLIKFDMSFMRNIDEGDGGKIILTELMKMATSLGVDTVCEGVETLSQVQFLQEIGCSKLQGYYFSKPLPFETIRGMHADRTLIANENPDESEYYESIGRVNLYDLGVLVSDEEKAVSNVFNTLPIAILEIKGDDARYVRSNRSYQDFVKRFFHANMLKEPMNLADAHIGYGQTFIAMIRQCCSGGSRVFFDEKMGDGSVVHSLARRVNVNPVTGATAVAIAVLSITKPDDSTTYADIARCLAADYYNIYVIDLDTDRYIEYSSNVGGEELSIERHGEDFFTSARLDTMTRIFEEDREPFLRWFSKENIVHELDAQGVFTITYRLIDTGKPIYVNMKVNRMPGGNRIILGVSTIDAHMKQKEKYEELKKEREMLVRIMALSDGYLSLYTVDPKTGSYVECSSTEDYDTLGTSTNGDDFFGQSQIDAQKYCYPEDWQSFKEQFTLENVLREIRQYGSFSLRYRLVINGEPRPVILKAAPFKEGDEDKLVVGVRAWRERHNSGQ